MANVDVIRKEVSSAAVRLDDAEAILSRPPEEFLADDDSRDLASFYLFLAIQKCIDLAVHWIARAGWASPGDARGAFDLLADKQAIDQDLASGLGWAVALWQRIDREYWTVDHANLLSESQEGIFNLRRFLAAVATEAGL